MHCGHPSPSLDLRPECITNERRLGGVSGSAHLVNNLQGALIDGDLNRLHRCGLMLVSIRIVYHVRG